MREKSVGCVRTAGHSQAIDVGFLPGWIRACPREVS